MIDTMLKYFVLMGRPHSSNVRMASFSTERSYTHNTHYLPDNFHPGYKKITISGLFFPLADKFYVVCQACRNASDFAFIFKKRETAAGTTFVSYQVLIAGSSRQNHFFAEIGLTLFLKQFFSLYVF